MCSKCDEQKTYKVSGPNRPNIRYVGEEISQKDKRKMIENQIEDLIDQLNHSPYSRITTEWTLKTLKELQDLLKDCK